MYAQGKYVRLGFIVRDYLQFSTLDTTKEKHQNTFPNHPHCYSKTQIGNKVNFICFQYTMGNQISPIGVDYTDANSLGDTFNLPYFYRVISNQLLSGAIFKNLMFPGVNVKKRRSVMRTYPEEDLPIDPPWSQRRIKRSVQSRADIARANQEDEVMRGKTTSS